MFSTGSILLYCYTLWYAVLKKTNQSLLSRAQSMSMVCIPVIHDLFQSTLLIWFWSLRNERFIQKRTIFSSGRTPTAFVWSCRFCNKFFVPWLCLMLIMRVVGRGIPTRDSWLWHYTVHMVEVTQLVYN